MKKWIGVLSLFISVSAFAQLDNLTGGSVSGNFKLDAQTYNPDTLIGADTVSEKLLSNSYMNVVYTSGNFTAGIRFEGYFNTMLGYDANYDGFGLANRYASYNGDLLEVTAGNFYEQFGSGLVFRAYWDPDLGYDNSMDGVKVKLKPVSGLTFTGIIGKQRLFWETSKGIVRGADAEFSVNEVVKSLAGSDHRLVLGASFVSKYQADENPLYILPENVATGDGRLNYSYGPFTIASEYAYKSQDPSFDNNYIYKPGSALAVNSNYSTKGFGAMLQYKWVDNMSFRSDRDQYLNNVLINSLPAITKNHTYSFVAMYPYATQLKGEAGIQAELFYKFAKESFFGGKYGTMVSVNFSQVSDIKRTAIDSLTPIGASGTLGYETTFLSVGDELFNRDVNIEISKKISNSLKGTFTYQLLKHNQKAVQGHGDWVDANVFVLDVTYKLNDNNALRTEIQGLFTKKETLEVGTESLTKKQDYGDWAMLMLEYTISPNWFFALSDQFNYISFNDATAKNTLALNHSQNYLNRNHFYSVAMGYSKESSRVALSFGKQREGILCVGGVCRAVPASYGALISITHTF